jgi:hypothetical protein|tara:strand:- start:55 stop:510 length:456 start_codon:yes stop_codon:yes gene_type:complete
MELKKYFLIIILIFFSNISNAEIINPNKKLTAFDVVKIQLEALKNNNKKDQGIKQTWLFAHPDNKKVTGPYERFRIMMYSQQYSILLNHSSHKIELMMNSAEKFIYKVKILTKDKKLFFYEWHVQKSSDDNCIDCWFTSAVSIPIDQGNTI